MFVILFKIQLIDYLKPGLPPHQATIIVVI